MPDDPRSLASVGDLPTAGADYLRSVGDVATQAGELADWAAPTQAFEAAPPPGYTIEKELGRGAFGVVYLARHQDDPETAVALKVIRARGTIDRLMLEPALLARLDHPNVVRVLDYFPHPDGGHLVIALEYVSGGDLKAAIDETERFSPAVVREVLVQLGGALAEAHAKGIVHRDLKPANVLLDRTGSGVRYVLTDFGVGEEDRGLRVVKTVAGTYLFMAPEQLRGRPGPQSDLWALGVVAYRMLTGEYPFPGPSADELSRQIQLTTPRPPSEVIGEPIDADLERAVLKLLDRSETERIGSATELLRELCHTTAPKSVRVRATTPSRTTGRGRSLDQTLADTHRRATRWMVLWVSLLMLLSGIVPGVCQLIGLYVFYDAHRRFVGRARVGRIMLACCAVVAPAAVNNIVPSGLIPTMPEFFILGPERSSVAFSQRLQAKKLTQREMAGAGIVWLVLVVGGIALPVLASSSYAKTSRARRERLLLSAAGSASPDEYLQLLRAELDYRYEDVGFHLRYAEALAARGDDRAAAIEARLLLIQDPYHFTANLLLAQSYLRLGLFADCQQVCDEYLAVAGYCFEFAELGDQARKSGAA